MHGLFYGSYIVLWILLIVLTVLVLLLYRHFGMMSLGTLEGIQRDGLPLGESASELVGVTPSGEDLHWLPSTERPSLVLFAAPECGPCAEVIPAVRVLAEIPDALEILVVTDGPRQRVEMLAATYHYPYAAIADDGAGAFNRYRVRVTPFAFVIGIDGTVQAKGLCSNPYALGQLLELANLTHLAAPLLATESGENGSGKEQDVTEQVLA